MVFNSDFFTSRRFPRDFCRRMTFRRDFAVRHFPCVEVFYFVISVFVRKVFTASTNVVFLNSVFGASRIDRVDFRHGMVARYFEYARNGYFVYAVVKYGFRGDFRSIDRPTILEAVFYGNIRKSGKFADNRAV